MALSPTRAGKFTASQIYRLIPDGKPALDIVRVGSKDTGYSAFVGDKVVSPHPFRTVSEYSEFISEYTKKAARQVLSVGAKTYCEEVAVEIMSEPDAEYEPEFQNIHIRRGNERELQAIAEFMMQTGIDLNHIGDAQKFIDMGSWGATPDGITSSSQTIDVKCPTRSKHLHYMLSINDNDSLLKNEPAYFWQQQCQIAAAEAEFGYWCSFNPMFKAENHKLHIVKINKDQDSIDTMLIKIKLAEDYLQSILGI